MNEHRVVFGRVPPVVWILALLIGIVEVAIQVFSFTPNLHFDRIGSYILLGFDPVGFRFHLRLSLLLQSLEYQGGGAPITLLTYPFIHLTPMSSIFSLVFVLCLGSLLNQWVRQWAVVAAFCLSGMAGGLAYSLYPEPALFLVGAAPGYLGMLGLLSGLLVMEYGRKNPFISPGFTGFPPLLFGIIIVQDVIFGLPGFYVANAVGFICGWLLSLLVVRESLSLVRVGLYRLFRE